MNSAIVRNKLCTDGKVKKVYTEWNIRNFSLVLHNKKSLSSPIFSAGAKHGDYWFLNMQYSLGDLQISLNHGTPLPPYLVKCRISILHADNQESHVQESSAKTTNSAYEHYVFHPVRKTFLLDEKNGLISNDTLTILCVISILEDTITTTGCNFEAPEYRLLDNLGQALESQRFCDVTIDVRGHEIRAHKLILVAGSPVFEAMFKHNMKEQRNSHIRVTDLAPKVFEAMLKFMYTGKATNLDKMAEVLLEASNKYALETLKVKCEEALTSKLGTENAADILILADLHNAQLLKFEAIKFIQKNSAHVIKTGSYTSMATKHPHLALEVVKIG